MPAPAEEKYTATPARVSSAALQLFAPPTRLQDQPAIHAESRSARGPELVFNVRHLTQKGETNGLPLEKGAVRLLASISL